MITKSSDGVRSSHRSHLAYLFLSIFAASWCASAKPAKAEDNSSPISNGLYQMIIRPSYTHRQKKYERMENSIRGLLVYQMPNGRLVGKSEEIIATISSQRRPASVSFVNQVGADVLLASKIAMRAVKLRYPDLQSRCVRFSFSNQYVIVDGNSIGCSLAILMLSLLENTRLDRKMAITGAVTSDWRVRAVGGLEAKIDGAIQDHLDAVVVPKANARSISDVMVLDGPQTAWQIEIFSTSNLIQAMSMMRYNKPRDVNYAMLLFDSLKRRFKKDGIEALKNPVVIKRLTDIVALAPNDLSSRYLLAFAAGKERKRLSIGASLYEVFADTQIYDDYLWNQPPPNTPLLKTDVLASLRQLGKLEKIISPKCLPLVEALRGFVRVCGSWAGTPMGSQHIYASRLGVLTALNRLGRDKKAIDRIMRSGF
jgi:hypothetical protein